MTSIDWFAGVDVVEGVAVDVVVTIVEVAQMLVLLGVGMAAIVAVALGLSLWLFGGQRRDLA